MFRRVVRGQNDGLTSTGSPPASAPRRARAPIVVVSSVVALAVLTVPAYWLLTASQFTGGAGVILAAFAPGALLVLSWLVRLVQWRLAARAPGASASVTAHLAQSPQPQSRGRATAAAHAAGTLSGVDSRPQGYAVWLTLRGPDGAIRYQRVVWEPWLRELTRPRQATVRCGPGPVTVIDVHGRGRLWPASFTLRRRPYGVRLTPFSKARRLPKENSLSFGRLAFLFVLLVAPCVMGSIAGGDWVLLGWWVAYVVAFMAAVGTWFGIIPPGATPGGSRRGRSQVSS